MSTVRDFVRRFRQRQADKMLPTPEEQQLLATGSSVATGAPRLGTIIPGPVIRTIPFDGSPQYLAAVSEIPSGDYLHPLTQEELYQVAHDDRNSIIRVAVSGIGGGNGASRVVGYSIYCLAPGHVFVERIVVHPEYRGLGVATMMVDEIRRKLDVRRSKMTSHADERDRVACEFWKAQRPDLCRLVSVDEGEGLEGFVRFTFFR